MTTDNAQTSAAFATAGDFFAAAWEGQKELVDGSGKSSNHLQHAIVFRHFIFSIVLICFHELSYVFVCCHMFLVAILLFNEPESQHTLSRLTNGITGVSSWE